jgi:hypothetical protein
MRGEGEHAHEKLMIAVALAFAMIGGAVAVFTVSSTYVAACPTTGC